MSVELHTFTRYTKRFFSGTLLSRFSGMFRDIAMAFAFGDHPMVAAFMVAFRFSQLFRRIFGEGSLQSTFIPHYEQLRLESKEKASFFFKDLTFYLILTLSALIAFSGIVLVGVDFLPLEENLKEIFHLTLWMLPSLIFVCLYALNSAALQCHGSYFLPGFAPVICNLTWIAACLSLNISDMKKAMVYFSIFVVVGFFLQWLITVPSTFKALGLSLKNWFSFKRHLSGAELKKLSGSFFLAMIGVGATQMNSALDALFAHFANIKGPIYLWYAIRIEQLPIALFGIAFVSALTPTLSRLIKAENIQEAKTLFTQAKNRLCLFMVVCSAAFFSLGLSAINLVFRHGRFSEEAIGATAKCLYAYGMGLVPATLVFLYSAVFYAQADFKTPTRASLISVGVNVALNAFFVMGLSLGEGSVALATSFSSFVNLFLLHKALTIKGFISEEKNRAELFKVIGISLLTIGLTLGFEKWIFGISPYFLLNKMALGLPTTLWTQGIHLAGISIFFICIFLTFCYALKCQSLLDLVKDFFFKRSKTSEEFS